MLMIMKETPRAAKQAAWKRTHMTSHPQHVKEQKYPIRSLKVIAT
jgi:hypothetical protein